MSHPYALSFEPEGGGSIVPADAYAAALAATVEALKSARNDAAPVIAARRHWPVGQVRECLGLGIGPCETGSLVVPVVVGGRGAGAHIDQAQIGATYWRLTGRMLKNAASGRGGATPLASAGALAFAKAARVASDAGCGLRLVQRSRLRDAWTTTANLGTLEPALRGYAERRQTTRTTHAQVIGQLTALSLAPPTITLATAGGKRTIRLPAELRDPARKLWGEDVIVNVEGKISIEGDAQDMKAVSIQAVPRLDDDAFAKTLGAGKDVWGDEEARAYIEDLRGTGEARGSGRGH